MNTLPSKVVAIPYTCGLSRLISGAVVGEHSSILGITIREDDIELPPTYLDYEAMVRHHFVERNVSVPPVPTNL